MELSAIVYQRIISCNNEGVRLMLHDKPDRAMECFKGGITLIRSKLNDEDKSPQHCQEDVMTCVKETLQGQKIVESIAFVRESSGVQENDMNHAKAAPPTSDISSDMDNVKPHSTVINDRNEGFVSFFHRVLVIPDSATAEICEMGDPCSLLSAVILFNIGLSHHRTGLQSASQSFRLAKALSLYGTVGSILERSQDQTISTKFGLLVYLASCNNMAHIYSEMCAFQELRKTWKGLFDVCFTHHQVIDSELHPEEQDVFLLNAFLFADGANIAPVA